MRRAVNEKVNRNLEFYIRWRIKGENIYNLIDEYKLSYPRAFQIKHQVETRPQYKDLLNKI